MGAEEEEAAWPAARPGPPERARADRTGRHLVPPGRDRRLNLVELVRHLVDAPRQLVQARLLGQEVGPGVGVRAKCVVEPVARRVELCVEPGHFVVTDLLHLGQPCHCLLVLTLEREDAAARDQGREAREASNAREPGAWPARRSAPGATGPSSDLDIDPAVLRHARLVHPRRVELAARGGLTCDSWTPRPVSRVFTFSPAPRPAPCCTRSRRAGRSDRSAARSPP